MRTSLRWCNQHRVLHGSPAGSADQRGSWTSFPEAPASSSSRRTARGRVSASAKPIRSPDMRQLATVTLHIEPATETTPARAAVVLAVAGTPSHPDEVVYLTAE